MSDMPGNPFFNFMAAGDAEARRLLGVPGMFRRAGVEYATATVICAPAMEALVYVSGGAEYQVKMTATVRKDDMADSAPRQGDLLTVNGETYQVAAISTSPADPLFTLQLGKHL